MIDNQFVTTDNPSDMVHIIKGIVGNFDNLSIHDASTDEERSAIEEVLKL